MLVITRNEGESVRLYNDNQELLAEFVYVQSCGRTKIRLGIEADKSISIVRTELVGTPNGIPKKRANP